ncbi:SDR family oxidoreductase [Nocardia sp. NPDC005978]|uniref:SDR family NAD(P)-dependent oxidoreductase n=1 Tax=unclassified Nocardia TaxID=2637762 RepID=UPI0033ACAEE1
MERNKKALITGASAGFGRAVALELASRGWQLVISARGAERLARVGAATGATAVAGDIADPAHRRELVRALGGEPVDLVLNNAGGLGPSPLPALERYPLAELRTLFDTNVIAPLALTQLALPALRAADGVVVNISSDAAVAAYAGWGGYGATKAALDQLTAVLAVEHPELRIYGFDPGDMRTGMHQAAFPGEDISDRPEPDTVVPALLRLLGGELPSGRYAASQLVVAS